MDEVGASHSFFVVGGTIWPGHPSYIRRAADDRLYDAVKKGELCHVLSSRQTGKSSLLAHAANRLKQEGFRTADVDLTRIGSEQQDAEKWYFGVAYRIFKRLGIDADLRQWWRDHSGLPALQRLTEVLRWLVSDHIDERVVLFFDEIESTLNLEFTDDFFLAIRACYNARAMEDVFQRLSFVISGVASPAELIKDSQRTPFNVSTEIRLSDFTREEALPLVTGLSRGGAEGEAVLDNVLVWTSGHPYLTQNLLSAYEESRPSGDIAEAVGQLAEKEFILAPNQDTNVSQIQHRLDYRRQLRRTGSIVIWGLQKFRGRNRTRADLGVYGHILDSERGGARVRHNQKSIEQTRLKIAGLVRMTENDELEVRNRIYRSVFDRAWVRSTRPKNVYLLVTCILFFAMATVAGYLWIVTRSAIDTINEASEDVPRRSYEKLLRLPIVGPSLADEHFAAYWDRRAEASLELGELAESLVLRLEGMVLGPTRERGVEAARLAREFDGLIATFYQPEDWKVEVVSQSGAWVALDPEGRGWLWNMPDSDWREAPIGPLGLGAVAAAAFSQRGHLLAAGGQEGQVCLWRMEAEGGATQTDCWQAHESRLAKMALGRDGRLLVTGGRDGVARLWFLTTDMKRLAATWQAEHSTSVEALALSQDGQWLATAHEGSGKVLVLRLGLPVRLHEVDHRNPVTALAFSPKGEWLVTAGATIKVWQLNEEGPSEVPERVLDGHQDLVTAMAVADRTMLVSAARDGTVRAWRLQEESSSYPAFVWRVHQEPVRALAIEPRRRRLVTGSEDGRTQLWELPDEPPAPDQLTAAADITVLDASPGRQSLAIGGLDGKVALWQLSSRGRGLPTVLDGGEGHEESAQAVSAVAFDSENRWLATGTVGGTVHVWDRRSNELTPKPVLSLKEPFSVTALAFSSKNNQKLFLALDKPEPEGAVILTVVESRETFELTVSSEAESINYLGVSPDDRWLAAIGYGNTVYLQHLERLDDAPLVLGSNLIQLAFAPDGRWLATGSLEGLLQLWDLEAKDPGARPVASFDLGDPVITVSFDPAGSQILAGSRTKLLHRFITDDGAFSEDNRGAAFRLDWPNSEDRITRTQFSPTGRAAIVVTDRWVHVLTSTATVSPARRTSWPYALSGLYWFLEGEVLVAREPLPSSPSFGRAIHLERLPIDLGGVRPLEAQNSEYLGSVWKRRLALSLPKESTKPRPVRLTAP